MTKVLAVIHHLDDLTSVRNAQIARDAGAAGVMLIEMNGEDARLDVPAHSIKTMMPELFVGTNRLCMHPAHALDLDHDLGLDGTWVDNPGLGSFCTNNVGAELAQMFERVRQISPEFMLFGSVAFKTQPHEPYPGGAAMAAARLGWTPTTSGPQTGVAPDVAKIVEMRRALDGYADFLPRKPELAVASGMTPENIAMFRDLIDWALVATGISADFHNFDPARLAKLVRNCAKD